MVFFESQTDKEKTTTNQKPKKLIELRKNR